MSTGALAYGFLDRTLDLVRVQDVHLVRSPRCDVSLEAAIVEGNVLASIKFRLVAFREERGERAISLGAWVGVAKDMLAHCCVAIGIRRNEVAVLIER